MIEAIVIINILASFGIIAYITKNNSEDKKNLVREITKAMLAKDITEYAEVIPEDNEDIEEEIKDELVEVDSIDEKLLIKQLTKEYENNKDKN